MKRLVPDIRRRALNRCEYCHLPAAFTSLPFEVDHIIAEQHGGETALNNLAWCCFACNHHKGPNLAGIDPTTRRRAYLFHLRKDRWSLHFRWNGAELIGRTPTGPATIATLKMNLPARLVQRQALMQEGTFQS